VQRVRLKGVGKKSFYKTGFEFWQIEMTQVWQTFETWALISDFKKLGQDGKSRTKSYI
jgi:hypothetical protein